MAVQMAGMFLPALAKVGAAKLPLLLRAAGITAGAAPSLMRGDLGGAVVGGGLGALGTLGLGSAANGNKTSTQRNICCRNKRQVKQTARKYSNITRCSSGWNTIRNRCCLLEDQHLAFWVDQQEILQEELQD